MANRRQYNSHSEKSVRQSASARRLNRFGACGDSSMGNQPGGHFAPIFNPPVPYRGYLPMAPGHGSTVFINGNVPTWCNRFEINLETDSGDKALHFNPRFEGTNQVIRNTCRSGSWGSEERGGHFPFHLGQPFEMAVTIEERHFKISVNGRHMCNYNHRIPKDYARQLTISGDIELSQIRFQQGGASYPQSGYSPAGGHHHHHHSPPAMPAGGGYPQPPGNYPPAGAPQHHPPPVCPPAGGFPQPPAYPGYPQPPGMPIYNPPMPVNCQIPGGLHPGKMIRINGQTGYNPSRFNVNLVHSNQFHANADIALHCDFRFNYGDNRNVVVRNHRQRGSWGQEERHSPYFPFVPGQPFEVIIKVEHDKFMIAANNQHMFEFRHRSHPLHKFDHLFIDGEVNVSMIQFQ